MRLVFVAAPDSLGGALRAFDMPLLYVRGEQFVQPIFYANYFALHCFNVALGGNEAPHFVTLAFKEGGAGTFLTLFNRALAIARGANTGERAGEAQHTDAAEVELRELRKSALMDPSDPSIVFVPAGTPAAAPEAEFSCDETASAPEKYPVGLRRRGARIQAIED